MKFLKKSEDESNNEEIRVTALYEMHIQCLHCNEWDLMKGGPIGDNKAKFQCGICGKINDIKWLIDNV